MTAYDVFYGSDRAVTRRWLSALATRGPRGIIAAYLFRAQKASTLAKKYRGGVRGVASYRSLAYNRKNDALVELVSTLRTFGDREGIAWGWQSDPNQPIAPYILYIDLPTGQCSFHSEQRLTGPDYPGDWDGLHRSAEHILDWCEQLVAAPDPRQGTLLQEVG
jgi:hypothetical protein